jgi:phosphatidylserine synthase
MVSKMPAFSYFSGGDPAVITAPPPKTASATNPLGAIAAALPVLAGDLALAGLLFFSAGSSTLSGLGVEAGLAVIVSLLALALAFKISTQGRRRMTALFLTVVAQANPSDSQ